MRYGYSPFKISLSILFPPAWMRKHPDFWRAVPLSWQRFRPWSIARQNQAYEEWPEVYEELPGIACPVLLVTGTEDVSTPPGNTDILAARIPGARLVRFRGAGHGLMYQFPDELAGHRHRSSRESVRGKTGIVARSPASDGPGEYYDSKVALGRSEEERRSRMFKPGSILKRKGLEDLPRVLEEHRRLVRERGQEGRAGRPGPAPTCAAPTSGGPSCRGRTSSWPTCGRRTCATPTCAAPTSPSPTSGKPTCAAPTCPAPSSTAPSSGRPTCPGPTWPAPTSWGASWSGRTCAAPTCAGADLGTACRLEADLEGADLEGADVGGARADRMLLPVALLAAVQVGPARGPQTVLTRADSPRGSPTHAAGWRRRRGWRGRPPGPR